MHIIKISNNYKLLFSSTIIEQQKRYVK